MPNRLANSPSLYLRQHAENPVDWWPWGPEAMAEAQRLEIPILLSVGYSSCHWCHVMAHESFEDESSAALVNASFLPIKLDREEHPEVDEAYMQAVLLANGRGGWPMTVFALPTGEPFFAGTYFPPEDHGDRMGFRTLLTRISELWVTQREELERAAGEFAVALRKGIRLEVAPVDYSHERLLEAIEGDFDPVHGGFGKGPKFPPHSAFRFLQTVQALEMADTTMLAMANGGIHDRVGGGFHRYSTDAKWRLPHFEKTLYDNALLLTPYLWVNPAVTVGIVDWLEREMRLPDGLYASALDADSEGDEGVFYTWTTDEVRPFCDPELLGMQNEGNFRDEATGRLTGQNVLLEMSIVDPVLRELRAVRESRSRPTRDDKALVGWNGLAISGLVEAQSSDHDFTIPRRIVNALMPHIGPDGRLPRYVYDGQAYLDGSLEDYAYLARGILMLAWKGDEIDWPLSKIAELIVQYAVKHFYDEEDGGFFSSIAGPFGRKKSWTDSPTPSANAIMAELLFDLGDIERARSTIMAGSGWMARMPLATEAMHAAAFVVFPPMVEWRSDSMNVYDPDDLLLRPRDGATIRIRDVEYTTEVRLKSVEEDVTYQICRDGVCELPRTLKVRYRPPEPPRSMLLIQVSDQFGTDV